MLSETVARIICEGCGTKAIGRPVIPLADSVRPVAANEIIVARLLERLKARGAAVRSLHHQLGWFHDGGVCPPQWRIVICNDVGAHSRISGTMRPSHVYWPRWLYDFDRWIGRLDSTGDTNLLLVGADVVPIDWSLSFTWAATGRRDLIRDLDDFNIPCHPEVLAYRDSNTISMIRDITDDEIWLACSDGMTSDVIAPALVAAYYTGLKLRRKLL